MIFWHRFQLKQPKLILNSVSQPRISLINIFQTEKIKLIKLWMLKSLKKIHFLNLKVQALELQREEQHQSLRKHHQLQNLLFLQENKLKRDNLGTFKEIILLMKKGKLKSSKVWMGNLSFLTSLPKAVAQDLRIQNQKVNRILVLALNLMLVLFLRYLWKKLFLVYLMIQKIWSKN